MNTYASSNSSVTTPSLESIMKVFNELKRQEQFRETIELAKREGVVYVGPGIECNDLNELAKALPGVEMRHVPYLESGTILAVEANELLDKTKSPR